MGFCIYNNVAVGAHYLIDKYKYKRFNALNTVGYKEIFDYIDGLISKEEAIDLIKRNTRRYAKRQLTWFRKDERIKWIDISSLSEIDKVSSEIIKQIT